MPASPPSLRSHRFAFVGLAVVAVGFVAPRLLHSPDTVTATPTTPDYLSFLIKMGVGTLVFTGLCYLAIRRIKPAAPTKSSTLDILASVPIASCGVVHLVQAGKRRLLLGVDLHGVKTLVELPGPLPESIMGPFRIVPEGA